MILEICKLVACFAVILLSGWLWSAKGAKLRRIYLSLLVGVSLSSCMTVGRIERNCDKFYAVCVQTEREVHYRDTIVQIPSIAFKLPESKIDISINLKVTEGKINPIKQTRTMGLITTEVEIVNNKLYVKSWLNDSTVLVKPDPIIIHDAVKNERVISKVPIKYTPAIYKYSFWIVVAEILILLALLAIRFKPWTMLSKLLKFRI